MNKKVGCSAVVLVWLVVACHGTDYFTQSFSGSFDLNGMSLTLTPDGSANYYSANAVVISELPVDASSHNRVTLTDDSSVLVVLDGYFEFYGDFYDRVAIGSNGYLTFTEYSTTFSATLSEHFAIPRVSTFFRDLNPAAGGRVVWERMGDRFVVTFLNVPIFGSTTDNLNTFQTELFYDGRIRMSWLNVTYPHGIVGVSRGSGYPSGFIQTDLSSFAWDLDGDEIPNTWEQQYFGNPTNCLATADADGDGFDNKAEYICGTHPKQASSFFRITDAVPDKDTGAVVIGWNAIAGRSYRVLRNDNLSYGSFQMLDEGLLFPRNSYTATVQSVQSPCFYKVEVELAD